MERSRPAPALVGVGVGPGDPELLTVKAVRVLREADRVLVPVLDSSDPDTGGRHQGEPGDPGPERQHGRAEATVRAYVGPARVSRVPFACSDRGGRTPRRVSAWEAAAATVRDSFDSGCRVVAFATLGDPNVYSTFTYLAPTVRSLVPDVQIDTIPGVVAMQDLAARSGTVLVEGTDTLSLVPLTGGISRLAAALDAADTVVAYKCAGRMPELRAALEQCGRADGAVYGAMLGVGGEDIRPVAELDAGEHAAYLSTVIAPGRRAQRGEKLP